MVLDPSLGLRVTAKGNSGDDTVSDYADVSIEMMIRKFSVSTDKQRYVSGDVMRACMVYKADDDQDQLEFEMNVYQNRNNPFVDYLSSYSVSANNVLVVTWDYQVPSLLQDGKHIVAAEILGDGALFAKEYSLATAKTTVYFSGVVEQRGVGFIHADVEHSIKARRVGHDAAHITVSSTPRDYNIKLLETVYVDLDDDGVDDVSMTYMGMIDGKADIRTRTLPKEPVTVTKPTSSYETAIGESPVILEKPQVVAKAPLWQRIKSGIAFFVIRTLLICLSLFLLFVLVCIICDVFHLECKFIEMLRRKTDNLINSGEH
jgi:hypothetical protein